jgi:uncharacterized damage-inducible protein DinB
MTHDRLAEIGKHLDPPPGVKLWHGGATVLGCLRGVTAEAAAWRPAPGRHSIWALTLHVAYWKYAVRRRITGEERGAFPRSPSNWPVVPDEASEAAWKGDRALLREEHDALVEAIASFDPARLDDVAGDGTTSWAELLWGIVLHDVYHVGQIQMLKRLYAERA